MSVKPTKYRKKTQTTLPEYEVLTEEEQETILRADCCVCDNPGSTMCNPESPNGIAAMTTWSGGQALAFWLGK